MSRSRAVLDRALLRRRAGERHALLHVAGAGPAQVVAVAPAARHRAPVARGHRAHRRRLVGLDDPVSQLLLVVPAAQVAGVDAAVAVGHVARSRLHAGSVSWGSDKSRYAASGSKVTN